MQPLDLHRRLRWRSSNNMDNIPRGTLCPHCGRYNSRHVVSNGVVVKDDKILLIRRGIEPEIGKWALPGGYMDWDETIEQTVVREVKEETGIDAQIKFMIGVYTNPQRKNDPNQNVSIIFSMSPLTHDPKPQESEIQEIQWGDIHSLPEDMAFDHADMIKDYLRKEEHHGK
jgi:ADP-ribose pyrophosphatase YjhB (NUDIX family)